MNLIDKDILLNRIQEARDIAEYSNFPAVESGLYQAEQIVRESKPERSRDKGFWTLNGHCSNCAYRIPKSVETRNFCPKCGVDMRG